MDLILKTVEGILPLSKFSAGDKRLIDMKLMEKQLAFQITTCCTLNCALCADYSPSYENRHIHYTAPLEEAAFEISQIFSIYSYIEDLTITGGEPLLHKNLAQIIEKCMDYQNQFGICRIFTNGTLLPEPDVLKVMETNRSKIQFVIDDYGSELSKKVQELQKIAIEKGLLYRVNSYHGDSQHCGGWVDYGSPERSRNYSHEKVAEIHHSCHNANWKNLLVFKYMLHPCTQSTFGFDLGFFKPADGEFVDLRDTSKSMEEKQKIAAQFGKSALVACQYCNGFDVNNSPRFPAGQQLPRNKL